MINKGSVIRNGFAMIALAGLAALPAQADTTTTTSTQNVTAVAPSFVDRLSVSYSAALSAGALSNPLTSFGPDKHGTTDKGSPILLENVLGVGYKISDTLSITPGFYWLNWAAGGGEDDSLGSFQLGDSYIRLKHSKLAEFRGAKLSGDIRYYIPMSTSSNDARSLGNVRATESLDYDIPNSKVSLNLTTYVRKYFYNDYEAGRGYKSSKGVRTARLYAAPFVSYQVNDKISVGVLYEMQAKLMTGKKFFSEWDNEATNLEPGLSWDITKNVNFNPWIDIPVGYRIATDTMTVGAGLSWKLL